MGGCKIGANIHRYLELDFEEFTYEMRHAFKMLALAYEQAWYDAYTGTHIVRTSINDYYTWVNNTWKKMEDVK